MSTASAPRSWRPDEVRRREFTVRFRGLDSNEVRGFLNAVADDLGRHQEQITTLTQDNTRLRGEVQGAEERLALVQQELRQAQEELQLRPGDAHEVVTEQAVLLLDQAQQLADQLIDEGMQSARDLMVAARSHQREIVDPGAAVAEQMAALQAMQPPTVSSGGPNGKPTAAEVEDIRTFAKVAQVQFRAVLEALNEQVNRLDNFEDGDANKSHHDSDIRPIGAYRSERG